MLYIRGVGSYSTEGASAPPTKSRAPLNFDAKVGEIRGEMHNPQDFDGILSDIFASQLPNQSQLPQLACGNYTPVLYIHL